MEIIRKIWNKLFEKEYTFLCVLIALTLVIHFAIIFNPPEVVFDEIHYTTDAQMIINDHASNRLEHPPLGKLIITSGIVIFGDNAFGWRFFSILFGTANILLLFLICRRLKMSRLALNFALFLFAFENINFVQGSLAMLDVFNLTFMLLSFWLYLREQYLLSGISVALAALCKLTGVFALVIIFLHWIIVRRKSIVRLIGLGLTSALGFLGGYILFQFVIYRQYIDFIASIRLMLSQAGSLTFANSSHPFFSRPWDWVIKPTVIPYFYNPNYLGMVSYTVWALIIPAVVYMAFKAFKKSEAAIFGICWFIGTYLVWIPLTLITDRISFEYYIYPTVGAICIGLGLGFSQLIEFWQTRKGTRAGKAAIIGVTAFLTLHLALFIILGPFIHWPAWLIVVR